MAVEGIGDLAAQIGEVVVSLAVQQRVIPRKKVKVQTAGIVDSAHIARFGSQLNGADRFALHCADQPAPVLFLGRPLSGAGVPPEQRRRQNSLRPGDGFLFGGDRPLRQRAHVFRRRNGCGKGSKRE